MNAPMNKMERAAHVMVAAAIFGDDAEKVAAHLNNIIPPGNARYGIAEVAEIIEARKGSGIKFQVINVEG